MKAIEILDSRNTLQSVYIDDVDFDLVNNYIWWIGYCKKSPNYPLLRGRLKGSYNAPKIKMSRLIMNFPIGDFVVDHKNRNPLDNRRENLRICTQAENLLNKSEQSNNTSGERHIFYDKSLSKNKWKICIQRNKKIKHFGVYPTKEDAKNALELIIKTQL